jgi:hypothetical protein
VLLFLEIAYPEDIVHQAITETIPLSRLRRIAQRKDELGDPGDILAGVFRVILEELPVVGLKRRGPLVDGKWPRVPDNVGSRELLDTGIQQAVNRIQEVVRGALLGLDVVADARAYNVKSLLAIQTGPKDKNTKFLQSCRVFELLFGDVMDG